MNSLQLSQLNRQIYALFVAFVMIMIVVAVLALIVKGVKKILSMKNAPPSFIIASCSLFVLGYLGFAKNVLLSSQNPNLFQKLMSLAYPCVGILCTIGLWKMKKWGLLGLIVIACLIQIFHIFLQIWTPASLLPFIPLLPLLFYYKKMK